MVLVNMNEKFKNAIAIINGLDLAIVEEFLRIANEFMKKEINQKMLNSAAQKLNLKLSDLKDTIEALIWILLECSKLNLNEKELNDSLVLIGINAELLELFHASYSNNSEFVRAYLAKSKLQNTHDSFRNLEWRIDVKVATRSIRNIIEPEIILKFDLESGKTVSSHVLQTDPLNLINLTNSLEDALNEIKTNHCRRILKNIV